MKKIFITGSTTGLGQLAGHILQEQGHEVVFHARSKKSELEKGQTYVFGDLTKFDEVKSVAAQANDFGPFDAIIHNAGVYTSPPLELFAVNVLAPYVLLQNMPMPSRVVLMSSGLHLDGKLTLDPKKCTYSDTKLFDLMLAKWLTRTYPKTFSNAVDPGWVPTRMGGSSAPDDLRLGAETQAWLAVSDDKAAQVSGQYFHHKEVRRSNPIADSTEAQEQLLEKLSSLV